MYDMTLIENSEQFILKPQRWYAWSDFISLSIGFRQMLCTVASCYWFYQLLWFYKTNRFLSLRKWGFVALSVANRPSSDQHFSSYSNNKYFLIFWGILNTKLLNFQKNLSRRCVLRENRKPCFGCCCMCGDLHKLYWLGVGGRQGRIAHISLIIYQELQSKCIDILRR